MSTIACPNCGKPLRAGARFCGNCGTTLPAPVRPAAPPPASDVSCPHCSKPIRQGARFCSSCGNSVDLPLQAPTDTLASTPADGSGDGPANQPAEIPPDISAAIASPITPGASAEAPAGTLTAPGNALPASQQETRRVAPARRPEPAAGRSGDGARAVPPPAALHAAPKVQGRRLGAWVALVAILACLGLLAGAYFMAGQMGWLEMLSLAGGAPTTEAVLAFESTGTLLPTASLSTVQPSVPPAGLPTAVSPATASAAPLAAATTAPLATAAPLVTSTLPAPTAPPTLTAVLLFEDTFDNGLTNYWSTWGSPRPLIARGPGDAWLSLKALEAPAAGGITSRRTYVIFNEPGAEIEFEAQLDPNYPTAVLLLDWDPLDQFDRGPDNYDPGLIHLEIRKNLVLLQTPMSGEKCSQEVNGQVKHTYVLRLQTEQAIQLLIDGQAAPDCSITDMGLEPMSGSISFSGLGWVTRVKVSLP